MTMWPQNHDVECEFQRRASDRTPASCLCEYRWHRVHNENHW